MGVDDFNWLNQQPKKKYKRSTSDHLKFLYIKNFRQQRLCIFIGEYLLRIVHIYIYENLYFYIYFDWKLKEDSATIIYKRVCIRSNGGTLTCPNKNYFNILYNTGFNESVKGVNLIFMIKKFKKIGSR